MTVAPKKTSAKASAPAKAAAPAKATTPAKRTAAKTKAPAKALAKKAAAAKPTSAPAFAMPAFEMPSFALPEAVMPEGAVAFAEKSIESARDAFDKTTSSVEEQGAAIEKSFDSATQSAKELNKKALEAAKSNMDAGFNLLSEMMTVKSLSDAVELQTNFVGKQFDALSAQSKDIQETLTKGIQESSAPVKTAAEKAMETIKAA